MSMDREEKREADEAADEALVNCAHAARTWHWLWTQNELYELYGLSIGPDAAARLRQPPFNVLTPYQVARLRAWHAAQLPLPLGTSLRLAEAYVGSVGNCEAESERLGFGGDDTRTLRKIAARAGVRSELRLATLEVCCKWRPADAVQALRMMTSDRPVYDDVYAAFQAEMALIWPNA